MSNIPADLRYAASHEWTRQEADGTVTIGITDHAQDLLGDVTARSWLTASPMRVPGSSRSSRLTLASWTS